MKMILRKIFKRFWSVILWFIVLFMILWFFGWFFGKKNTFTIEKVNAQQVIIGTLTAYSNSEDETDFSPDIAANGYKVFEGGIANNCLPFKTQVKINGQIFIVNDRMNRRYDCSHFDIFIPSKIEALQFGLWKNQEILIQ